MVVSFPCGRGVWVFPAQQKRLEQLRAVEEPTALPCLPVRTSCGCVIAIAPGEQDVGAVL